jgi:hypothetical protein
MVAFNGVNPSAATTREGRLRFYNKRAEGWWRFREELDADQEFGSVIALPPDASIKADLAAPRWELTARASRSRTRRRSRNSLAARLMMATRS